MTTRLPWQRNGTGFIAYPEGEALPGRRAELEEDRIAGAGRWKWRAYYDLAAHSGGATSRQAAADDATAAWPGLIARAAKLQAEADAEAALVDLIEEQQRSRSVPLEAFAIEKSDSDRLRHIISSARKIGGDRAAVGNGPLAGLCAACSAELFRRRVASAR